MSKAITNNRLAEIAATVQAEHTATMGALRESMAHAVNIGALLTEAKQLVKHGDWGKWIMDNCQFSERTAQNYMRVYAKYPQLAKSATVADLTYREAVGLLAESNQTKIIEPSAGGWIEKLDQAQRVTVEIQSLINEIKQANRNNVDPYTNDLTPARRMLAGVQELVKHEELEELVTAYCDLMRGAMLEASQDEIFPMLEPALQQKVNDWLAWANSGVDIWKYQPPA